MKFTLAWLKQHLDTSASLDALCAKLTAIGLEVEGLEDRGAALAPFVIAEIIEAEKHPQADRLRVCKVQSGQGLLQIVCGAPNARAGLKTVLAHPGDVIPKNGEKLKLGVIRGVESQGMMCSFSELGLSEESDGIIELPADAPVGASYAAYAGLNDPVIEINLTPNRGDCAGVRGIARDLVAAGMGSLKPLSKVELAATQPASVGVTLDFPQEQKQNCPLFVGRVIRNIKNGPSPAWLQRWLLAVGVRPLSALVDITNYLTLDCNRPLHVFDAAKIQGGLRVSPAKGGEQIAALNGKTYTLEAGMTVISDASGPLSIAGVMGGESTRCMPETTAVFIESAVFSGTRTAQTGRALQLNSDARYRFERGIDPVFTIPGADLAAQLVLDFCGTPETVIEEAVVAGEVPSAMREIVYNTDKCRTLIGVDVPVEEQVEILTHLGFGVARTGTTLTLGVPSWRSDVIEAADITEEVMRIKGYDSIPALSLHRDTAVTTTAIDGADKRASQARRALAGQGLYEAVTWSFMPSSLAEKFGTLDEGLRLVNPISADLDVMRPTIIGNLLQAAQRNAARGFADQGLFEVGPVYRSAALDGQSTVATALRAGATPRHWKEPVRPVDVFDAKADALAALAAAGAPVASLQVTADAPSWYHPGRSGALRLGPKVLAYFGELHPSLLASQGIEGAVVVAEIFIEAIPAARATGSARPLLVLDELQAVTRDFAFLVDLDVPADKFVKAARGADKALIRDVVVFDVYQGSHVEAGKKSVALSVTLQPTTQSLTEAALADVSARVTAAVVKATGAILRG